MPQNSFAYAVGRVRVLESGLMTTAALSRMAAAQDVREMLRLFSELSWGEAARARDAETLAARNVAEAARLVRAISPDAGVTDCLLLPYDIHNLKAFLKARMRGTQPEHLSGSGLIAPETIEHAVRERNYRTMPDWLREALESLERALAARGANPLEIDAALDRALSAHTARRMRGAPDTLRHYYEDMTDMTNLRMALRAGALGVAARLDQLLLSGGALPGDALTRAAGEPERLALLVAGRRYEARMRAGLARCAQGGGIARLEKEADDHLMGLLRPHRYEPTTILPLVGYYVAREREALNIKLLFVARANGYGEDALSERLRELYA